jgi:hypothetical protein
MSILWRVSRPLFWGGAAFLGAGAMDAAVMVFPRLRSGVTHADGSEVCVSVFDGDVVLVVAVVLVRFRLVSFMIPCRRLFCGAEPDFCRASMAGFFFFFLGTSLLSKDSSELPNDSSSSESSSSSS